jgi:hypothetical protein
MKNEKKSYKKSRFKAKKSNFRKNYDFLKLFAILIFLNFFEGTLSIVA